MAGGATGKFRVSFDFSEAIEVTKVGVKSTQAVKQHTTADGVTNAVGTEVFDVSITCFSPDDRQSIVERVQAVRDPNSKKFSFTYTDGTRTYLCKGCALKDSSKDSDQNGTVEHSMTFATETHEQIR